MAWIKFLRDTREGEVAGRIYAAGKCIQVDGAELHRLVATGAAKKSAKPRRKKK